MDLGVNFFDTADAYGTERLVGQAIKAIPREQVVVSTKYHAAGVSADRIATAIDTSLSELDTEYIDVFQLHGVKPQDYAHALNVLAPELLRARGGPWARGARGGYLPLEGCRRAPAPQHTR